MSKNPNTVESQDDVTVNQGSRNSSVLLATIEKCERLQKQLDIAVEALREIKSKTFERYSMNNGWAAVTELRLIATQALKELEK